MNAPSEQIAFHVMVITQFAASSLLFPWLMRDARISGLAIFTSVPLIQLAGWLSQTSGPAIVYAVIGIVIWLTALALASRLLTVIHTQLIAVCVMSTAAIGGMILLYLRMEFAGFELSGIRGVWWCIPGAALLCVDLVWMLIAYLRQ
jgi:hypothetical protein